MGWTGPSGASLNGSTEKTTKDLTVFDRGTDVVRGCPCNGLDMTCTVSQDHISLFASCSLNRHR